MCKRNNAVCGCGRVRARDLYDLAKVNSAMMCDIENIDKQLMRNEHVVYGKQRAVCVFMSCM